MKRLILLPMFMLAASAYAEDTTEIRVNRIDMAVTAPDEDVDTDSEKDETTRATDYNSSRSNISSRVAPTTEASGNDSSESGGRAQDYNSSRSNREGLAANDDGNPVDADGDDCDDSVDQDCVAPANHNTTRSK